VQALAARRADKPPELWLVTQNAEAVTSAPSTNFALTPLWGLGKVIAAEHPELHPVMVDLDEASDAQQLFEEISNRDGEDQIAFRQAARLVARLVRSDAPSPADADVSEAQPVQLDISARGILDNLHYRPTARRTPRAGEIEIRVHATGLNFRDVLNALGMYPGNPGIFGGECSGRVVSIGEGVTGFAPGDEVLAIAPGSFATFVTTARQPGRSQAARHEL